MKLLKILSQSIFMLTLFAVSFVSSAQRETTEQHADHMHDHEHDHAENEVEEQTPTHHEDSHKHDAGMNSHDDEKDHDHALHSDEHDHHQSVSILPKYIALSGVETRPVQRASLTQTHVLYGHVRLDPSRVTHVQARYPGVIKRVRVNIGDKVEAGQTLIDIEANQSLKTYQIKAPFAGLVTARHANVGEQTREQSGERSLLTITDSSQLVAELAVFPGQMTAIEAGQAVYVIGETGETHTTIQTVLPAENDAHYITARIPLENTSGIWRSGMPIKAEVVINTSTDQLVVPNAAIQTLEGKTVVFVQDKAGFSAREIQIGMRNASSTEVLEGLEGNELIVIENSYLIKAEFLKGNAEHIH